MGIGGVFKKFAWPFAKAGGLVATLYRLGKLLKEVKELKEGKNIMAWNKSTAKTVGSKLGKVASMLMDDVPNAGQIQSIVGELISMATSGVAAGVPDKPAAVASHVAVAFGEELNNSLPALKLPD